MVADAARDLDMHIVAGACPGQQRIPGGGFGLDQFGRSFGAVAEQVGLGISGQRGGEGGGIGSDAIDRGIGEAGQRHRAGIDRVTLRGPFCGDRLT